VRRSEGDRAREYLEHRMRAHRDRNNVTAIGASAFGLGLLSLEDGNYPASEEYLLTALQTCRNGGNILFELWVLPVMAELYLKTGQANKAAEYVARGFELLKPDQNWHGLPAPLHTAQGILATAERRWDEAEKAFAEAVALNRRYECPWDEAKTLYEWGLMRLARGKAGDREKAQERLGAALEIFRRVEAKKDVEKVLAAIETLRT
jgi:tetratricopeptide (TPR) repeat protein